jgi:hypothetical protein
VGILWGSWSAARFLVMRYVVGSGGEAPCRGAVRGAGSVNCLVDTVKSFRYRWDRAVRPALRRGRRISGSAAVYLPGWNRSLIQAGGELCGRHGKFVVKSCSRSWNHQVACGFIRNDVRELACQSCALHKPAPAFAPATGFRPVHSGRWPRRSASDRARPRQPVGSREGIFQRILRRCQNDYGRDAKSLDWPQPSPRECRSVLWPARGWSGKFCLPP